MATFVSFVFSSEQNVLTPGNVFKSMSLFAIMSMPMGLLPLLVVFIVEVITEEEMILATKLFWVSGWSYKEKSSCKEIYY